MELAIVVLLITAGVIFYIVRPGSKHVDPSTPVNPAPAAPPAPEAPPQQASDSSAETNRLMRLTKADLEKLAVDAGVDTSGTKADIVSRLIP